MARNIGKKEIRDANVSQAETRECDERKTRLQFTFTEILTSTTHTPTISTSETNAPSTRETYATSTAETNATCTPEKDSDANKSYVIAVGGVSSHILE